MTAPAETAAAPEAAPSPARMWVRPSWRGAGGVRELLVVSLPMILSQVSAVVNMFFDRWYLSIYDLENHMAASLTASVLWWLLQQLPMGIVAYVGTFIAQYTGAGRPGRVGSSLWQALWLAFAGGIANLMIIPLLGPGYRLIHGETLLASLETTYTAILCAGSIFLLINTALSFFYAGRGKTLLVMGVQFLVTGLNVALNSWWIFHPPEWLPFIEPGISGAGWATTVSLAFGTLVYVAFVFSNRNERRFRTRSGWRIDWPLMRRMVRYGLPNSVHFMIDVAGFSFFLLVLGRLNPDALTASSVAFTINQFVFIPLVGMSLATGIVVGHHMGARRLREAEKTTCAAELMTAAVITFFGITWVVFPDFYIDWFLHADQPEALQALVREQARIYLIFVAVFSIGDVMGIIYSGALKGAGDTRAVMVISAVSGGVFMLVPAFLAVRYNWPANAMWLCITLYLLAYGTACVLRWRTGKWKKIHVIEHDLVAEVEAEKRAEG